MDFSIPTWVGPVGGSIAGVVAIFWAVIQAFSSGWSSTSKQRSQATTELVALLSQTVDTLKRDFKDLQEQHLESIKQIATLRGENESLMKILQGRDKSYVEFQQNGLAAFKRISEMDNNLASLAKSIELLVQKIKPNAI